MKINIKIQKPLSDPDNDSEDIFLPSGLFKKVITPNGDSKYALNIDKAVELLGSEFKLKYKGKDFKITAKPKDMKTQKKKQDFIKEKNEKYINNMKDYFSEERLKELLALGVLKEVTEKDGSLEYYFDAGQADETFDTDIKEKMNELEQERKDALH